jgi:hypothetical protein
MSRLTSKEVLAAKELIRKQRGNYCHLGKRRKEKGLQGCGGINGRAYKRRTGRDFILNHKDHNPHNNPPDGSNWELSCNSCNTLDRPRSKSRYLHIGISPYRTRRNAKRDLLRSAKNSHISLYDKGKSALQRERDRAREKEANKTNEYGRLIENPVALLIKRYRNKEKKFRKWVENKLITHGSWDYEDVINAGAEEVDANPQTVKKWLNKMTSSSGQYSTLPGKNNQGEDINLLVFKPEYQHKVIDKQLIPKIPTITPDYIQQGIE